jgi:hypothetical protein
VQKKIETPLNNKVMTEDLKLKEDSQWLLGTDPVNIK